MSWLKDHAGAVAGAVAGGPANALTGGALGAIYDNKHKPSGSAKDLYNDLSQIGAAWTDRGYSGYENLTANQVEQALGKYEKYPGLKDGSAWAYLQNLQARKNYFDQIAAQEEAQAAAMEMWKEMMSGMQGALEQAADAAAYVTPYAEVLKKAPGASADARDETAQRQALRRGLMSTFSSTGGLGGGTDF